MFFLLHKKRISEYFPKRIAIGPKKLYTGFSGKALENAHDFLLTLTAADISENDAIETIKFVKDKKYVCRVRRNLIPDTGTTFILKTFLFNKIRHRFRNTWRPLDELFCQLTATGRGVPTPEVYGLYRLTDKVGLTRQAGIVMEDLAGFETLQSLFPKVDSSGRKKLLGTISSAIKVTYDNGCHHVDLNLGSILVNPADYSDFRIIDFQHAKFFNTPNDESFLFMISHISKGIRPLFGESGSREIDRWIREVAKTVLPLGDMGYINQRIGFYNSHDFRRKHREMIGNPGFAKLSGGVLEKAKLR